MTQETGYPSNHLEVFEFILDLNSDIEDLQDQIDHLSREIRRLEDEKRVMSLLQSYQNRLFGDTLLLAVSILRYAKENDQEHLDQAVRQLQKTVNQAGDCFTSQAMGSGFCRELIEVVGKTVSTRSLKSSINPKNYE